MGTEDWGRARGREPVPILYEPDDSNVKYLLIKLRLWLTGHRCTAMEQNKFLLSNPEVLLINAVNLQTPRISFLFDHLGRRNK
jgi:hypothetical protein